MSLSFFCLSRTNTLYLQSKTIIAMKEFLLVGIGGAVGAMMRYGITLMFTALGWSTTLGTLLTNILGSFCMGLLVSAFSQSPLLLMATVGICGGFTTYSTFSAQSVAMLQQGQYGIAILYMLGTVAMCVIFAFIGYKLGS